ncbi:MAG: HlyD family secretion protein [Cetobacterium somerae]|uniref:HlyD family secretion protein n=1 Tax=Cetobacterium TaxID=180162 RepID=UPI00163BB857|nr:MULTISPECIES: efflux RND transporter periplasmic adaptor subunit [Cetobacterium]MBC2852996.1 HlyD family secretion protein [Cetobacterium sp. 2G large]MCQ9627002.1 HlyD family secretion protein [Cetobacterium somerae]WVJ01174.1 efflux RND transporter periplasmic adaptor subunit [Cetobacterium somerae]
MIYKKKAILIYVGIFFSFLVFLFLSVTFQMNIPYSSRAFLEYQIAPVYSKVSGSVDQIFVKNGEFVNIHQPLFSVDNKLYKASYTSALGQYNEALDSIKTLKSDIEKNKIIVEKNRNIYLRNKKELTKFESLYKKSFISEIDLDNMRTKVLESEKTLKNSEGILDNLLTKYKTNEDSTPTLLIAEGALEKARINLQDTTILSPINGEVVMDNFYQNTSIKENTPLFYIKNDNILKVNVDLKEKNIKSITPDRRALILFDGIPGIIFKGTVENISPILAQGYSTSSSLVNIPTDNRWIRDNGKIRVSIIAENSKSIKHLSSGSMASVILLSETNNIFYNFLAKIWINIIMVFNYVY